MAEGGYEEFTLTEAEARQIRRRLILIRLSWIAAVVAVGAVIVALLTRR
jgi:hypothetical protein